MIGFDKVLVDKADALLARCRMRRATIATAESCTGGMIAALLTSVAGSSEVFDRSFVTYSNQSKIDMLGVLPEMLAAHGAVSSQCAEAMTAGVLARSPAMLAVAVTGIAGPGGGTLHKPVGLVHFGCAMRGGRVYLKELRFGDRGRHEIRLAAVDTALDMLRDQLA
jgi:nicotinamide-nucleotide amidase